MLAAYKRQVPDSVPVSPELWDATAIAVARRPFYELVGPFADVPWWQTHLAAFEYFGADAWIVPGVGRSPRQAEMVVEKSAFIDDATVETDIVYNTPQGPLHAIARTTSDYSGWLIEHPVKQFPADMERYECYYFDDPDEADVADINEAIAGVGEKGLVTPGVGELFTSFLATVREGGMVQTIYDLNDYPEYCWRLHARYVEHISAQTRVVLEKTRAQAIFVNSGYSAPPIISPAMYRRFDVPVLKAVSEICHQFNVPLHLHQHGHVQVLVNDLIGAGVDIVCPLLPPPQGDVADLGLLKRLTAGKMALKGNVDPIEVLLKGSPADVERAVLLCIEAAAEGGGYILGTADSTVVGTPFENIHAFVEAGRKYGRY